MDIPKRFVSIGLSLIIIGATPHHPIQAKPAAVPSVSVGMWSDAIRWSASPLALVEIAVRGADGVEKASGADRADVEGRILVHVSSGGQPYAIQPADRLVLTPERGQAVQIIVPSFAADMDAETDMVMGIAPAGSQISVTLFVPQADGSQVELAAGAAQVDGQGRFSIDMSSLGDLDAGDSGRVTLTLTDGNTYNFAVAAFDAAITLRRSIITGRSSVGTGVTVTIRDDSQIVRATRDWVVSGSFDWSAALPADAAPEPGWSVSIEHRSPDSGEVVRSVAATIPDLRIDANPKTNTVSGYGPPNTALAVDVREPRRFLAHTPNALVAIHTRADGRFEASLSGQATLAPGWKVTLVAQPQPGLRVIAPKIIRFIRVGMYGNRIEGSVMEGTGPITVTVHSESGALKGQGIAVNQVNRFEFGFERFWGSGNLRFEPGDSVEVEYAEGDPLQVVLPVQTAQVDMQALTVSGQSVPNASLQLEAVVDNAVQRQSLAANDDGAYRFDLGGSAVLKPGTTGAVITTNDNGWEFYLGWAAPSISVDLGGNRVTGTGPAGRTVEARLLDAGGRLVAGGSTRVASKGGPTNTRSGSGWSLDLTDSAGQAAVPLPGQQFEVVLGDDMWTWILPDLRSSVDAAADVTLGTAPPGALVTVMVWQASLLGNAFDGQPYSKLARADDTGHFAVQFGPSFDIQPMDKAYVSVDVENGLRVQSRSIAAGVVVDLGEASVSGVSVAGASLAVTLERGGSSRASTAATAGSDGSYHVLLRTRDGTPVVPQAGDRVEVIAFTGSVSQTYTLSVPELTVRVRPDDIAIHLRASAGGTIGIRADSAFRRAGSDSVGASGKIVVAVPQSGDLDIPLIAFAREGSAQALKLRPGTRLAVRNQLPDGNFVVRTTYIPIVNAPHGSSTICGVGDPGQLVEGSLVNASGTKIASAKTVVGADNRYLADLVDSRGKRVTTAEGQRVQVVIGDVAYAVDLPALKFTVDWSASLPGGAGPYPRVRGTGPRLTQYYVTTPLSGCFTGTSGYYFDDVTTSTGLLERPIDLPVPGDGAELAFYSPDGHRFYRQAYKLLGQVHVDTDRVTGLATAGGAVSVAVLSGSGDRLATVAGEAAPDGRFDVRARSSDGQPLIIRSGMRVAITAGDQSASIPVEPLSFDYGDHTGIVGQAPSGRDVRVMLALIDGRTLYPSRRSDALGRFSYLTADMPLRPDWTFADVLRVTVVLPNADGHEIVTEAQVRQALPTDLIFLPSLKK